MDLFSPEYTDEERLADAMTKHWQAVKDRHIREGIIPPWIECDVLLQEDERRLLELCEDHAGYVVGDDDKVEHNGRMVQRIVVDMGMRAPVNFRATLNRCLDRKLVTVTRNNALRGNVIDMAQYGRYLLEIVREDGEFDE